MKIRLTLLCAVLAACLSGCKTCLEGRLSPSEGLTAEMRSACVTKPRCYITYELKSPEPSKGVFGERRFLYARKTRDVVAVEQRNVLVELIQGSGLFSALLEGERDVSADPSISMTVSAWVVKPGDASRYDFSFLFDLLDVNGVRHQYRMNESVVNYTIMGNCAPGLAEMFGALHRKVVNNLLVKMYEDGFFAGETLSPGISANVRTTVISEERKKNLDSLLKAGVITEDEYKKEIGKEMK